MEIKKDVFEEPKEEGESFSELSLNEVFQKRDDVSAILEDELKNIGRQLYDLIPPEKGLREIFLSDQMTSWLEKLHEKNVQGFPIIQRLLRGTKFRSIKDAEQQIKLLKDLWAGVVDIQEECRHSIVVIVEYRMEGLDSSNHNDIPLSAFFQKKSQTVLELDNELTKMGDHLHSLLPDNPRLQRLFPREDMPKWLLQMKEYQKQNKPLKHILAYDSNMHDLKNSPGIEESFCQLCEAWKDHINVNLIHNGRGIYFFEYVLNSD